MGIRKHADDPTAPVRAQAAAGSIPAVTVPTTPAPAGKKGPVGTSPRTNYSRVNTGTPMMPDAGATEQKSLQPKYGSIMLNGTHMKSAHTPTLQDMVKAAQAGALSRMNISQEAQRQLDNLDEGTKTAEEKCEHCGKHPCECNKEKKGSLKISTAYAVKAAEALEFLASEAKKEAATTAPPPHLTEYIQEPGKGPGALEVSHATASTPLPDHKGQGHMQPPMKPGGEKVLKGEHGDTQMETNFHHAPGGKGEMVMQTVPKHAAAETYLKNLTVLFGKEKAASMFNEKVAAAQIYRKNCEAMGIKVAEDAIFPAHISAGKDVPPETSAAGQPGGEPVGGKPQGTKGTGSNEESIHITKGQAKSAPKSDLKKYFNEPALTSSTDDVLRVAFDSTGQAGTKFASSEKEGQADAKVKTAAARALLENLLESVKGNKAA